MHQLFADLLDTQTPGVLVGFGSGDRQEDYSTDGALNLVVDPRSRELGVTLYCHHSEWCFLVAVTMSRVMAYEQIRGYQDDERIIVEKLTQSGWVERARAVLAQIPYSISWPEL